MNATERDLNPQKKISFQLPIVAEKSSFYQNPRKYTVLFQECNFLAGFHSQLHSQTHMDRTCWSLCNKNTSSLREFATVCESLRDDAILCSLHKLYSRHSLRTLSDSVISLHRFSDSVDFQILYAVCTDSQIL